MSQKVKMTSLVSRLWWRRYLSRNARSWDELQTFPALSASQQRAELARRLFDQIQYFGKREDALPEWREAAKARTPEDVWKLWPSLPIVTKSMLQNRFRAEEIGTRFGIEGRVDSTGGSTGEPTRFYHDVQTLHAIIAQLTFTELGMGWKFGMPVLSVWGADKDIGKHVPWKTRLHYKLTREYSVEGYELNAGTVDQVLALLARYRPVAFYGFTTMLEYVAQEVIARGAQPARGHIATAWNGGEMLYEHQSELFEQAFGVPILNRYGGRELSTMACQFAKGGPLQVLRPWLHLEVLDEQGKPAEAGVPGRLVWTSTLCRGTPFLRYEIEDWGTFTSGQETEAGVTQLARIEGRSAGLLQLPGGKKINNLFWNHLFKEFGEVRQFQVVVRDAEGLRFLLKGSGWEQAREQAFRATVGGFLDNPPIEVRWVDEIPRTKLGKRLQVVKET